jgi:hypothetical protein
LRSDAVLSFSSSSLCTQCKAIRIEDKGGWPVVLEREDIYPEFPTLKASENEGCKFCSWLRSVLLDEFRRNRLLSDSGTCELMANVKIELLPDIDNPFGMTDLCREMSSKDPGGAFLELRVYPDHQKRNTWNSLSVSMNNEGNLKIFVGIPGLRQD